MLKFGSSLLILPILALVCLCGAEPLIAQERVWTDKSGVHKLTAEFVKVEEGDVFLRRPDGETIALALSKLSIDDQNYVRDLLAPGNGTEPTTEPPVTQPPVTEPPVTEPPVTQPPVTQPPVTVTEPPKTEPRPTQPIRRAPRVRDDSVLEIDRLESAAFSTAPPLNETSEIEITRIQELQGDFRALGTTLHQRENVIVVNRAFEVIADKGSIPPLMIELISELADSSHKHLRMQAIRLLAKFDPQNSLPKILEAVSDNGGFDVRWTALELVEHLQDDRAIDTLIERFPSKDNGKVLSVLVTFGNQIEERIFPFLESKNRDDITNAMSLLTKIGSEKSIPKIEPFLESELVTLRLQAESSIRQLKTRLSIN